MKYTVGSFCAFSVPLALHEAKQGDLVGLTPATLAACLLACPSQASPTSGSLRKLCPPPGAPFLLTPADPHKQGLLPGPHQARQPAPIFPPHGGRPRCLTEPSQEWPDHSTSGASRGAVAGTRALWKGLMSLCGQST